MTTATITDERGEHVTFDIPERRQLSFEVGGDVIGQDLFGTVAISGKVRVERDLDLGDEVQVQVISANGEVLSSVPALIGAPGFREHRDKDGAIIAIERAHRAKVID